MRRLATLALVSLFLGVAWAAPARAQAPPRCPLRRRPAATA